MQNTFTTHGKSCLLVERSLLFQKDMTKYQYRRVPYRVSVCRTFNIVSAGVCLPVWHEATTTPDTAHARRRLSLGIAGSGVSLHQGLCVEVYICLVMWSRRVFARLRRVSHKKNSAHTPRRTPRSAHTSTIKLPRNLSVHLIKAAQSLERHLAAREATAAGAVVGKLIILDDRRRQERLHR